MFLKALPFFLFLSILHAVPLKNHGAHAQAAITYDFSGGRFGDNLLAYLHAKWLAYQYQMPLLYKPFPYSSELVLDDIELSYDAHVKYFKKSVTLGFHLPTPNPYFPYIYVCPYFPEIEWELIKQQQFTFDVDWKNKGFRTAVLNMISPKKNLVLTYPPKEMLSVAIHLREGGGFDIPDHYLKHPLKTPPLTYYVESLYKVLNLFKGRSIYCHIFTDALDPQRLVGQIQRALPPNAPIIFDYRKSSNRHDANVLEDFFSLFNFDILIRAESNYSIIPGLLNDYVVICSPATFSIQGNVVTIDKIDVEINEELYRNFR